MNTTPLPICHICLRTDKRLYRLNYELESYYETIISDYVQLSAAQFCGECITRLNTCYNFKNICMNASKKLKSWKKQKVSERMSLNLLYREFSLYPQLSLSDKRNFQLHFCQSADLDAPAPFEISPSKHPNIVTVNIPQTEAKNEQKPTGDLLNITKNIKVEVEFMRFDNNENTEDDIMQNEDLIGTKSENVYSSDSEPIERKIVKKTVKVKKEKVIAKEIGSDTDSDESLNEFLIKYKEYRKRYTMEEETNVSDETQKSKAKINIQFLKNKMREKFERYNNVKDTKGNEIDVEVILGCFDKLSVYKLIQVRKHCAAKGPFSKKAIEMLTELHEQYAEYDKMDYSILYIHDEAEMQIEFEKRRESSQYTESKHRCESCIRGFKSEKHVQDHMDTAHNEAYTFECKLCKTRRKSNYAMSNHMRSHQLLFKCKLCQFVTPHKEAMKRHCNRHAGITYKCKECGKEFKNRSVMYCHYNSMHQPKNPCDLCAYSSSSKNGLIHHKNCKHRNEKFVEGPENRRCETCDVTFINGEVYQKHLKVSHGVKSYRKPSRVLRTCSLCGVTGKGNLWLGHHKKAYHPELPVVKLQPTHLCETCGKGFVSYKKYKDHQNIHTGVHPYKCPDCPKTFHSVYCLAVHRPKHFPPSHSYKKYKDHQNIHTGVRPYKCPDCPKTFHSVYCLAVHRPRHFPPSHVCSYCGKKFTAASNLSNHIRIHVGNRRFKCDICGKGFLHNVSLRDHINGVHYNIKKKRNRKTSQE